MKHDWRLALVFWQELKSKASVSILGFNLGKATHQLREYVENDCEDGQPDS